MQTQTITVDSLHADVERCFGFNIWEDSSGAAVVELRAGSVTGTVVRRFHLAADESISMVLPKAVFLEFPGGCYVKEVSGSVAGVLDY